MDEISALHQAMKGLAYLHTAGIGRCKLSLVPRPFWEGETAWQLTPVQTVYFRCQRVGSPNQISARCHMTTVNRIASCVEPSQSRPFITIVDRSIVLV